MSTFALSLLLAVVAVLCSGAVGWTNVAPQGTVPSPRTRAASTKFDGQIVFAGGMNPVTQTWVDNMFALNAATNVWSEFPLPPGGVPANPSLCATGNGNFLVLVGDSGAVAYSKATGTWGSWVALPTTEAFHPTCATHPNTASNFVFVSSPTATVVDRLTAAPTTIAIDRVTLTVVGGGTMGQALNVFGTATTAHVLTVDLMVFSVAFTGLTGTATALSTPPTDTRGMAVTSAGDALVFDSTNTVHKLVGTVWTNIGAITFPSGTAPSIPFFPAADGANLIDIAASPQNLAFSLTTTNPVALTTKTPTVLTPPPMESASMARAATKAVLVGLRGSVLQTWVYDTAASKWVDVSATSAPPSSRRRFALAAVGGTAFLFGGVSLDGAVLNDLWTFSTDTNSWASVSYASNTVPPARVSAAATPTHGSGLLIAGGNSGSTALNDIWHYNPFTRTWKEHTVTPAIPKFQQGTVSVHPFATAVADVVAQSFVIVGGLGSSGQPLQSVIIFHLQNSTSVTHTLADTYVRADHTTLKFGKGLSTSLVLVGGRHVSSARATTSVRIVFRADGVPVASAAPTNLNLPSIRSSTLAVENGQQVLLFYESSQLYQNHTLGCADGFVGNDCSICPTGTYWRAGAASQCQQCPNALTTIASGAMDESQCLLQSFPQTAVNPSDLFFFEQLQQPSPLESNSAKAAREAKWGTIIGMSITGFVLCLIALFMVVGTNEQHDRYFKNIDFFFDEHHHIKQGAMMKRDTVCGGIFTILFILVIVTLFFRASRPYVLDNTEETVSSVPKPYAIAYDVHNTVEFALTALKLTSPCTADQVQYSTTFNTSQPFRVTANTAGTGSDCQFKFTCDNCRVREDIAPNFIATIVSPTASAEALIVTVTARSAYIGQLSSVTSSFIPPAKSVLRGPNPNVVVGTLYNEHMDDETEDTLSTGFTFYPESKTIGSYAQDGSWTSSGGVSVTVNIRHSDHTLLVVRKHKMDFILLLSALLGLFGGVWAFMALLSKGAEKVYYVYLTHKEKRREQKDNEGKVEPFLNNLLTAVREVFEQLDNDPYDKRKKIGPSVLNKAQLDMQRRNVNEVLYSILDAIYGDEGLDRALSRSQFRAVAAQIFGGCVDKEQVDYFFTLIDADKSNTLEIEEISDWLMDILFNPKSKHTLSNAASNILYLEFFAQLIIKNMTLFVETTDEMEEEMAGAAIPPKEDVGPRNEPYGHTHTDQALQSPLISPRMSPRHSPRHSPRMSPRDAALHSPGRATPPQDTTANDYTNLEKGGPIEVKTGSMEPATSETPPRSQSPQQPPPTTQPPAPPPPVHSNRMRRRFAPSMMMSSENAAAIRTRVRGMAMAGAPPPPPPQMGLLALDQVQTVPTPRSSQGFPTPRQQGNTVITPRPSDKLSRQSTAMSNASTEGEGPKPATPGVPASAIPQRKRSQSTIDSKKPVVEGADDGNAGARRIQSFRARPKPTFNLPPSSGES